MNFAEAREKARRGFHVRRESWTDRWFALWRGVWWRMGADETRVVQATDYGADEFTASDWTTIPVALKDCPPPPPDNGGSGSGSGGGSGDNGGGASGGGDPSGPDLSPSPGPGPGPEPGPWPPLPPSPPSPPSPPPPPAPSGCDFGSLSVVLTPDCAQQKLYVELTATGLSPGAYSVMFLGPMTTVSGGMIVGTGDVRTAELGIGDDFRCRTLTITARVTALDGPCRGQQQTPSASIAWCCEEPCTPGAGCCPGEDGQQCGHLTNGDPCCCCAANYAPNGPNCECVYVG